jgi:hypothetical protein
MVLTAVLKVHVCDRRPTGQRSVVCGSAGAVRNVSDHHIARNNTSRLGDGQRVGTTIIINVGRGRGAALKDA